MFPVLLLLLFATLALLPLTLLVVVFITGFFLLFGVVTVLFALPVKGVSLYLGRRGSKDVLLFFVVVLAAAIETFAGFFGAVLAAALVTAFFTALVATRAAVAGSLNTLLIAV